MNVESLSKTTQALQTVFEELKRFGLWDKNLRCRYAEFLVAEKLAAQHRVQVLNSRDYKCADIYLPDIAKHVEVKSCRLQPDGWADASFSEGNQISKEKFDYCVWIVFDAFASVKHRFVFTASELREVASGRKHFKHKSNPCLLLLAPNLRAYEQYIREDGQTPFKIERELLRNPKRFKEAWHKIK